MEVVLSLFLLALVYVLFRRKYKQPELSQQAPQSRRYAAVKIDACDFSCSAAFEQSSRLFLAKEAPTLPLEPCDCTTRCRCRFINYDDRRQNQADRRSGSQILQDVFTGEEQRATRKKGRRISDYQPMV